MKRMLSALLVVLAACSRESPNVDLSNSTVVLDVFSGRPNPSWQLTAEEMNELENALADLPKANPVVIPNQLGYRGFRIHDETNANRITVTSNGYVVIHSDSGDAFYRDTKGMERHLKMSAEKHGHGRVFIRPQ